MAGRETTDSAGPALGKWLSITVIAICQVAVLSLWFSATAALPALLAQHQLSGFQQSLFTSAVQIGFVLGSLASAITGLADRIDPRRLFMICALSGAAVNGLIVLLDPASPVVVLLRFLTGMALAGVYPVGMKMAGSWADRDMGLLIGLLVGALTLGSASPHLFNAFGITDWRLPLLLASASAAFGGLLIGFAGLGGKFGKSPRFEPSYVLRAWTDRPLRYANLGYLGHMWELYAMWAWIGLFLNASFQYRLPADEAALGAYLGSFLVIAAGALGCLLAGLLADRLGRTTITIAAMAVSGLCCIIAGLFFAGPIWLLLVICVIWGLTIVADSAQFSASVAELAGADRVGTMLTLQTALGFLLTLVSIHLMPLFVDLFGWRYAFVPLALGPLVGVWAMVRLRRSPAAGRLAGGRG